MPDPPTPPPHPQASFDILLSALLEAGGTRDAGRQAQHSTARCLAVLCSGQGLAKVQETAQRLLKVVKSPPDPSGLGWVGGGGSWWPQSGQVSTIP